MSSAKDKYLQIQIVEELEEEEVIALQEISFGSSDPNVCKLEKTNVKQADDRTSGLPPTGKNTNSKRAKSSMLVSDVDNPNSRLRSIVWPHYDRDTNKMRAKCRYCGKSIGCSSSQGTSSLRMHLMRCPNFRDMSQNKKQKTLNSMFEGNESSGIKKSAWKFDQDECRKEFAKTIIAGELPFGFVENRQLHVFFQKAQPKFVLPSCITLRTDCLHLFEQEKDKLKQYLSSLSPRVCLTIDTWSSGQNLNYMCLTCHFIDKDWKLQKKIINFCQITGHTGDVIGRTIEKCIVSWGITKVLTITVDNASSNDLAMQYLKKRFQSTLLMKAEFLHVRCCAHILNLTVKDGLKELDESIAKIQSAIKYVRSLLARLAKFKHCMEQENIESKSLLCLDVETRWNSTYLMLESAVKFEKAFDLLGIQEPKFVEELTKDKAKGIPMEEDWAYARNVLPFLKIFYDATITISDTSYSTCNEIVRQIFNVTYEINKRCQSSERSIRMMAERMNAKHDKYWGKFNNMNMLLFVAVVLDPRQKLDFLEWSAKKVYGDARAKTLVEKVSVVVVSLYDFYGNVSGLKKLNANLSSQGSFVLNQEENVDIDDQENNEFVSMYYDEKGETIMKKESELEKYLGEKTEHLVKDFDILDWWKVNCSRYPILALMAKDILAIPLSTVASESAFSTGGRVLNPFRSSLTPTMVEALICTQDWFKDPSPSMTMEEDIEELKMLEAEMLPVGKEQTLVSLDE